MLETNSQLLYDGMRSSLYFQTSTGSISQFIVKMLKSPSKREEESSQIHNEYLITQLLTDIKGVRKAIGREKINGFPSILLEYVQGITLKESIKGQLPSIATFLKIAIQIADILSQIHERNIIHKDINTNNIIYNPEKQEIKIIDFGISSKMTLKKQHLGNPTRLEGTLAYISPEQTGRMNRIVDYRSDLYSLGITLFEVLTGKLPFESNDPIELVHYHIAQNPPSPSEIRKDVPPILSQVILKLLSKSAELRYQSALGLKHDLEFVLRTLDGSVEIPSDFRAGQMDYSGKFQIPQKLYGREKEIAELLLAYERVSEGYTETLLVSGASGVGKSQLVHEIHASVTAKRGWFIEGKFEQFQKNVPYKAWNQALEDFVNLLLTEPSEVLAEWKTKILAVVGENGKILTDLIPNLELIIGKQEEVEDLEYNEAQSRFNSLVKDFLKLIARAEHPLTIFLDDLQWADIASLNLLEYLLSSKEVEYLLLICAYRDHEVSPSHPFMMCVTDLKKAEVRLQTLHLQVLSESNINDLLIDTLNAAHDYCLPLAELIYRKTQGNAFFVNQFLQNLYEQELLTFRVRKTPYGEKHYGSGTLIT